MTLSHNTTVRNAILDLIDTQVNAGTTDAGADVVLIDSSGPTDLVTFTQSDPAFGAASSATMALSAPPQTVAAAATGTADTFEIRDRDNTVVQSGTVTGTGGGGDMEIDNQSIASGQDVTLQSYTLTAPA